MLLPGRDFVDVWLYKFCTTRPYVDYLFELAAHRVHCGAFVLTVRLEFWFAKLIKQSATEGSASGDRIPVWGEIFRTCSDRPWGPPSLLYNGSFPEIKRPERGVDHPPTSSAEVKEKVELYLYNF